MPLVKPWIHSGLNSLFSWIHYPLYFFPREGLSYNVDQSQFWKLWRVCSFILLVFLDLIGLVNIFIWKNNKYINMHNIENIHKTQRLSLGKPERRKPRKLPQNSSITKIRWQDKINQEQYLSNNYLSLLFLSILKRTWERKWSLCRMSRVPLYLYSSVDLVNSTTRSPRLFVGPTYLRIHINTF